MTDETTRDDRSENCLSSREAAIEYEIDDEPPSVAVVRAVASLTNTPVLDLEPLYDVVDPDHLDGLFGGDAALEGSSVALAFNGCRVTVTEDCVFVEERSPYGD